MDGKELYKICEAFYLKMNNKENNLMRNALTQLTGSLTDAGFTALVSAYHLPAGLSLAAAQALVRGGLQGVMQNCYDDIRARALSNREIEKHDHFFDVAERTYFELAAQNYDASAGQTYVLGDEYIEQVREIAEHASIEAMRESQAKKIEVLGWYYGGEFFRKGPNLNFDEMHQIVSMVSALTFRQIVLIRLIGEEFKDLDVNLYVTEPTMCVEINRLKDYGIWQTEGATFGINESWHIQLKTIIPTIYSEKVCKVLMLDKISEEDIKRTIDGMDLKPDGSPMKILTEDDYRMHTEWQEIDENGNIKLSGDLLDMHEAPEEEVRGIVKKWPYK